MHSTNAYSEPSTGVDTGYTLPNKADNIPALMKLTKYWGEGILESKQVNKVVNTFVIAPWEKVTGWNDARGLPL